MWIHRELETLLAGTNGFGPLEGFPVWLLLGPRQVGKSSLLRRLASSNRQYVNLDDLETRTRARRDPILFARDLAVPCTIDEVQYAPELLSAVKVLADKKPGTGAIWLTGSQSFDVMKGVQETLAGRVAILGLFGLTSAEKELRTASPSEYLEHAFRSGFPALYTDIPAEGRPLYLSSYTKTYIERDVRELLGIQKRREFELFLKLVALRNAQTVNYDALARAAGISAVTAKEWLGLLEDSFLLRIVPPLWPNRNKRLVKAPKVFFLDNGLAAHLAGWNSSETLFHGPMGGGFFEAHVFSEIYRFFAHHAIPCAVHSWRTREGREVDLIVESQFGVEAIEVKMSIPSAKDLLPASALAEFGVTRRTVVALAAAPSEHAVAIGPEWELRSPHRFEWLVGK